MNPVVLDYVLDQLGSMQKNNGLDIVRIGTRLPIHNPLAFKDHHYEAIAKLTNPYIMVHINHPTELTPETLEVINRLRRDCHAVIKSQTVLLKGVNDNEETLLTLFKDMAKQGIEPYYLFQNDLVYWAEHFTVPIEKGIALWQKLRPKLSGLAATARFVIDVPEGHGKIPVPEGGAWDFDHSSFYDFKHKRISLLE